MTPQPSRPFAPRRGAARGSRITTARAEAQARANPIPPLHRITIVVLAVGLLVTAGLVVGSIAVHDSNEDRLLEQRGHEAATVAASSIGNLQGEMAAASAAAESGQPGDDLFRRVVEQNVGTGKRFMSASLWPIDATDGSPSVVVGVPPLLQRQDPGVRRTFVTAAAGRQTLSIRDFLGLEDRRLGYAYALPGAKSVVYLEAALPKNRRARIASNSAFADLDYALYLGKHVDPARLLASSSGHGLSGTRTAVDRVPFGNSSLVLVVSPRGELGGDVLAALPWVLLALGLLLTFTAAFLAERLVRRRERAEELSDRLEEIAEKNAALYTSQRQIARQLQQSLMPRSLPQFDGLQTAGRYEAGVAGTEVGGDWYDVLPLTGNRLAFSVGDVCGRGLGAAALMASLRYSIRAYALGGSDPATLLGQLSAMMESTTDDGFATLICGTLDAGSGTLTIARAGHPDLLLVGRDGARYLDAPLGPPVGVEPQWVYRSTTLSLEDDVVLIAFTDGLVERRREHLEIGLERLRLAAETDLPVERLVSHLVDSLADPSSDDDIAVLGMHWTRVGAAIEHGERAGNIADESTASLDIEDSTEAPRRARLFLRDTLQTWGLGGHGEVVELLATELVTNVVRHVGSPMRLTVVRQPSSIRVQVDDASTQRPVRTTPGPAADHGRGILLVESLSASWGVDALDAGKAVWFEVDLEGAAPS